MVTFKALQSAKNKAGVYFGNFWVRQMAADKNKLARFREQKFTYKGQYKDR